VIALTVFDLMSAHRASKVRAAKMVGTQGNKFPAIRDHFKKNIAAVYKGDE
jgi:D-galacturonate reductase